jgi:hypothetical protein
MEMQEPFAATLMSDKGRKRLSGGSLKDCAV